MPPTLDTLCAQALGDVDAQTGALIPAIHPSTTYARDAHNLPIAPGRIYARDQNPTFEPAERLITALEGGARTALFASGMAACTAVFRALSPGDHVLAPQQMYWALRSWLLGSATRWGLEVELVDMSDLRALEAALIPQKTKLVWLETPANPLWSITELAAASQLAHFAGALVAVDSTVATPVLTRPIEHGADLVVHAATKALNGHSDVLAGSVTAARADDAHFLRVLEVRAQEGAVLGPFEAWLLLRGVRTLPLRVRTASASALRIALHFAGDSRIAEVLYPGLPSFTGHEVAARQMSGGFGSMLSLRVAGGSEAALRAIGKLRLWKRATSLGGTESLVEHRASVEGAGSMVPADLLRFSVGIEDVGELIADLDAAL
jgi:cystathionine gamma-synthase